MNLARVKTLALSAGTLLALALLLGRFSGLVRELLLANRYGVSPEADLAVVLLTLPDLLVNILLSGGLSAALVPRLRTLSREGAGQLFRKACLWAVVAFGSVGLAVAIWPQTILAVFAPGLLGSSGLIPSLVALLLALSIPLTALSGITAAYLNANDRYFIAGLGTLIFNLTVIASLAWWWRGDGALVGLAATISVGALLRLLSQTALLPREAWRSRSLSVPYDPRFLAAFASGVTAASLTLLPSALIRAAASLLGPGNIAAFNYSQKLVELPIGILITTISTISLTRLSGHYSDGDPDKARSLLNANLRLSLLLAFMVVVFGESVADPVVALLFQRGAIDAAAAGQIAALVRVALLGVPFVAISGLAAAALNAQLRTPTVLQSTAIAIVALAVLAVPGLLMENSPLMMGSVVGSQAVLALLLARHAGIAFWGTDGVVNDRFMRALAVVTAVAAPLVILGLFFTVNNIIMVVLGALGFAIAFCASARFMSN